MWLSCDLEDPHIQALAPECTQLQEPLLAVVPLALHVAGQLLHRTQFKTQGSRQGTCRTDLSWENGWWCVKISQTQSQVSLNVFVGTLGPKGGGL